MQIRTHVGLSLDGFAAFADGLPAWDAVPTFGEGSHGIDEVTEQCPGLVIGRTSFDQGWEHWVSHWPYDGRKVFVLTTRPLPSGTEQYGVEAVADPADLRRQVESAGLAGDVQVLGGPSTIRTLLDVGEIDLLGVCILPVLLGTGVPLFAIEPVGFSAERWAASPGRPELPAMLPLESQWLFADGSVLLVYRTS
jgi:dihydrofolate reductase